MMKQAEHAEAFEEVLLSYAEMCYSVAFALTRNPHRAQDLARHVLTWAWHLRDSAHGEKDIKKKLLEVLRERFLQHYCQVPRSLRDEATLGDGTICIAQNAKWDIEKVSHGVRTVMHSP